MIEVHKRAVMLAFWRCLALGTFVVGSVNFSAGRDLLGGFNLGVCFIVLGFLVLRSVKDQP